MVRMYIFILPKFNTILYIFTPRSYMIPNIGGNSGLTKIFGMR